MILRDSHEQFCIKIFSSFLTQPKRTQDVNLMCLRLFVFELQLNMKIALL